jgi:hypothetical protein
VGEGRERERSHRGGRGSSILVLRTQCTRTGVLCLERYGRTTMSAGVTVSNDRVLITKDPVLRKGHSMERPG